MIKMDKYAKLNIIIGILLIISGFVIVTLNPNFNGLFVGTLLSSLAFLNLKIAQTKLEKEKYGTEEK